MIASPVSASAAYVLRLADDAFVLSHRLAEWSSRAPMLEEDVALSNIALDLLGQARGLYPRVAELDGSGRSEDDYVYQRDEREFVNCLLVEQDNGDFGLTMARQLLFSTFQLAQWEALTTGGDDHVAAVAGKAVKEVAYHRDHADHWVVRLGDGTEESHRRMQAGLDAMWPYAAELFERDHVLEGALAEQVAADPGQIRRAWDAHVDTVLREATLQRPTDGWTPTGGRGGVHSERFGYMLAEIQHLHRAHPGATW